MITLRVSLDELKLVDRALRKYKEGVDRAVEHSRQSASIFETTQNRPILMARSAALDRLLTRITEVSQSGE